MLDHIGVYVSDLDRMKAFYTKALAPLGVTMLWEKQGFFAGFGRERPTLWLHAGKERTVPHVHIAISARNRAEVDAFYEAAVGAGARDNGPPGLREIYHPSYYGAFVLDPEGHNLEAVIHSKEAT